MSSSSPPAASTQHGKNALEWTVFAVSCLLVLATISILIVDTTKAGKAPAKITVQQGQPYQENGSLWIPVAVTNTGGQAAVNVEIEALRPSESGETKANFTVDHLPRGATRGGHVSFPGSNPIPGVNIRVSGFQDP